MSTSAAPQFVGQHLGKFVADAKLADIPKAVQHEAKRSLLNFIGGAIGVARFPAVESAFKVLNRFSGPRTATLMGRSERMDALSASFINSVSSNFLDYDDTHLNTVIHPTAPVAPALFALAEENGASGADLLLAFILGGEIECRIGNSVSPGHYDGGWHITATCGVFGAAAAAAKLMKLSPQQIWDALGIAASEASGIVENLPSAAKNVGVGNAARNGLFAALMAQEGYAAAPAAIEGKNGWARATGHGPVLAEILGDLGTRWEIAKNTYKPYPCGIVMHSVIDASLELRDKHGLTPQDVEHIIVRGDALLLARGDRAVHNERDGRVSIHHSVAAPLLWGKAGVAEFSEDHVMHPDAKALREKVKAEVDASMPRGSARVIARTRKGATVEATVLHARGSLENPLSDKDIEAKVRELAAMNGGRFDVDRIIAMAWDLDRLPNAGELARLTAA